MKKFLLCIIALVVLLPACRDKQVGDSSKSDTVRVKRDKKNRKDKTGRNLFLEDEDVREYQFEEGAEGSIFSGFMRDETDVKLIETQDGSVDWVAKRAEQSQYGFKSVYFGFDRFSVTSKQKGALNHDINIVKDLVNKGNTIVVEGHACNSAGSAVYNMVLSEKRAQAVAKHFVDHGIPVDKLKVVGRGNEMCIVPTGDRYQQAPNRRVELYVL